MRVPWTRRDPEKRTLHESPPITAPNLSGVLNGASDPRLSPAAVEASAWRGLFSDVVVFRWSLASFRTDLVFTGGVAIALFVCMLAGHPGAALIAAGGAMTTGFGIKQRIEGTSLLPMLFVSLGMAVATFVGMVAGHSTLWLIPIATATAFIYGLLTSAQPGWGWVSQQCVVTLLVASAFPFSPKAAAVRASLILAGSLVQLVYSALLLRAFGQLGNHVRELARHARDAEAAVRETYLLALESFRQRTVHISGLGYALRLAAVMAVSTEVYRRLNYASGYWIPMTALLVLRPGIVDTASRAIARVVGTLTGAVLASLLLAQVHPPNWLLATLVVVFTWLAWSTLNVNYALFSVALTSYIVVLLSLANIPGSTIAHRRAVCTALGGALALTVRLAALRLRWRRPSAPAHA